MKGDLEGMKGGNTFMESILKDLYHGRIHLEEEYQPTKEIRQMRKKIDECQQALLEKLKETEPNLQKEMNALLEAENITDAMEMEEVYIQGMRMGAKLTLALLGEKK